MVLREIGDELKSIYRKYFFIRTDQKLKKFLFDISGVLEKYGFSLKFIEKFKKKLIIENTTISIKQQLFDLLLSMMQEIEFTIPLNKKKNNIVYFIGIQGSGKTTSIVKYASYLKRKCRFRTVGVVCADTFRAGAYYQLKQNCSKMSIPFYGDLCELDPVKIIDNGLKYFCGYQAILIDTSGRNMNDIELLAELKQMKFIEISKKILVIDGTSGSPIEDQIKFFNKEIGFNSCFVTKLDNNICASGSVISTLYEVKKPIEFLGIGEHLNMLERFDSQKITREILGYGSGIKNLKVDFDQQKKFLKNIGKVSLKEIMDEMNKYSNQIESISDMFSMMGFDASRLTKNMVTQTKLLGVICGSMTKKELMNPEFEIYTRNHSRMRRIALGSGHSVKFIINFINRIGNYYHVAMKNMVKKMNFDSFEIPKNVFSMDGFTH